MCCRSLSLGCDSLASFEQLWHMVVDLQDLFLDLVQFCQNKRVHPVAICMQQSKNIVCLFPSIFTREPGTETISNRMSIVLECHLPARRSGHEWDARKHNECWYDLQGPWNAKGGSVVNERSTIRDEVDDKRLPTSVRIVRTQWQNNITYTPSNHPVLEGDEASTAIRLGDLGYE